MEKHYLFPGALFCAPEPHMVTTLLGSCVSVCLWDWNRKIGGINHYLLPLWNGEGLASPRYGNIAMQRLLDDLSSLGCLKKNLNAKIFGGASLFQNNNGIMNIGERNIELARKILSKERIPIVDTDVGYEYGRKIIFDTLTGNVAVSKFTSNGNRLSSI